MYRLLTVIFAPIMGCPCCGPRWWVIIVARGYDEVGQERPPEVRNV